MPYLPPSLLPSLYPSLSAFFFDLPSMSPYLPLALPLPLSLLLFFSYTFHISLLYMIWMSYRKSINSSHLASFWCPYVFLLILHYIFTSLCSWIMPFFLHLFFLANFSPQALLSKNWRYSLGDEFTICMWVWWIYCFYALVFPGINSIWFIFFYEVDSKCVHATNSNVHRT